MNVYIPDISSQLAKRSFNCSGANFWNALPSFLKDIYDINDSKSKLKHHTLT
jgi:hypothetical protein